MSKPLPAGVRPKIMRLVVTGLVAICVAAGGWAQQISPRADYRTVVLDGKSIRYRVTSDGFAITDGDVILGTAAEIEAAAKSGGTPPRTAVVYLNGSTPSNWPDGVMYYTISTTLPNQQRVLDAIEHWNSLTPLKVLPRTGQANYVNFRLSSDGGCASSLGMLGGQQSIVLGSGCSKAAVIHEIGHAFGLLHEQSRQDRDRWLTVRYENIDDFNYDQFHQLMSASRDTGYYDYGSIMHYSVEAFSPNGSTTLETVPPGIPIGQRVGLSAGDIDAISRIYGVIPTQTTITTIPAGLNIVVDGERFTSPRSFSWGPGSAHTLAVDGTQTSGSTRNAFVRWTDGGAQSHTFTAAEGQTAIAAVFQQSFPVSASVASGNGAVSIQPPSADGYYVGGTTVKITATPAGGQNLYTWSGTNPEAFGFGFSAETLTITVRQALNFRANFTSQPSLLVNSSYPGSEVEIDSVPYYTPVRFLFSAGSTHNLSVSSAPQYDYTSSSRLQFAGWEDGSLATSRDVQMGTSSTSVSAGFTKQNYLNYDWTGLGSVTAEPGGSAYYDENSLVTLSALPRGSQTLQYWLGNGVSGGGATQSIVLDRPKYAYAVFGNALSFRPSNAASYSSNIQFDQPGTSVAPLEIVTLFGTSLGPDGLSSGVLDQTGRLSSSTASTRILFDGIPAPIVYASANQTSVVVPAEVAGRVFTVISAERNGVVTGITTASVIPALPGIFTSNASGRGQIAAFNQDYSLNSTSLPAEKGSVVTLYATGAGLMERPIANGAVMDSNLVRTQLPVYVRVGSQPAQVEYAGSAPTLVNGVLQVNFRVPELAESGEQPIRLIVGDYASPPGPTVAIR